MNDKFVQFDYLFDLDLIFDIIYKEDIDQQHYYQIDHIHLVLMYLLLMMFEFLNVKKMNHLMLYRYIQAYLVDDQIDKDVAD